MINIGWVGKARPALVAPQHPTSPMGAAPTSGTITSDIYSTSSIFLLPAARKLLILNWRPSQDGAAPTSPRGLESELSTHATWTILDLIQAFTLNLSSC